MKKFFTLLITAIIMPVFFSCSEKPKQPPTPIERPFVTNTKKNLSKWIDENIVNPIDFKILNMDVAWETDSLCVLDVEVYGENQFGGHFKDKLQYLNININGIVYEWCDTNVHGKGVFDFVKDSFKLDFMERKNDSTLMRLERDQTRAGEIYRNAYVNACPDISGAMMFESGKIVSPQ